MALLPPVQLGRNQNALFKLLGERVMARDIERQMAELQVRVALLNRFAQLGTPITVATP